MRNTVLIFLPRALARGGGAREAGGGGNASIPIAIASQANGPFTKTQILLPVGSRR